MGHVSVREVARVAGYSPATVSRALRRDPRIAAATRDRIQEEARRLGYRPNALLSALHRPGRRLNTRQRDVPLAFVTDVPEGLSSPGHFYGDTFYGGALRAAGERGFRVEHFNLARFPSARFFSRVLYQRGFRGVIIASIRRETELTGIDWGPYAVVTVNREFARLPFLRIRHDPAAAVRLAWAKAREAGLRRIAVACGRHFPRIEDDVDRLSAVLGCLHLEEGEVEAVPPFGGPVPDLDVFLRWVRRHRPDGVIGFAAHHYHALKEARPWGRRCPPAYYQLHISERDDSDLGFPLAGIWLSDAMVGEVAVDMIDRLLRAGELGPPRQLQEVLIPSTWREGVSRPFDV